MRQVVPLDFAVLRRVAPQPHEDAPPPAVVPVAVEVPAVVPVAVEAPADQAGTTPGQALEVVGPAAPATAGPIGSEHDAPVLFRAGSRDRWVQVRCSPSLYRQVTDGRALEVAFLVGMAAVFLANAVVALVQPAGFVELVASGPAAGLLETPVGPLVPAAIALNDFIVGAAVLAVLKVRQLRSPVLAWAGAWLMLVTVLKLFTLR